LAVFQVQLNIGIGQRLTGSHLDDDTLDGSPRLLHQERNQRHHQCVHEPSLYRIPAGRGNDRRTRKVVQRILVSAAERRKSLAMANGRGYESQTAMSRSAAKESFAATAAHAAGVFESTAFSRG
jgi:hypothetical protein